MQWCLVPFLLGFATLAKPAPQFLVGGDVSEIPEVEALGGKFYQNGKAQDPLVILKHAGWNFIRLRVWNDPKDGFCDKAHTLAMAKRITAQGMALSIDFHYSDWWADPAKQVKPKAWEKLTFPQLTQAVHDYTADVIGALVKQGTPPAMVQVGNEISAGMLWPDGRTSNEPKSWTALAALVRAGIQGVKDAQGKDHIKTMIHIDRGGDNAGARWWLDHFAVEKVDFDLIGLSYYPFWHGDMEHMQANLNDLAKRYKKDIYVVETAYPWTLDRDRHSKEHLLHEQSKTLATFPATPDGQANFLNELRRILREVPDGRGKGILYWAPTWISGSGPWTGWDNLATFDFSGNALPAVKALGGK